MPGRFPDAANSALNVLASIGNPIRVTSGDAKGAKGTVLGKHGGIEHIIAHFEDKTLEKLNIGDKVLIKAHGVGLKLDDFPEVKVMNLDPVLIKKMGLKERKGSLVVPVTHFIPAEIMGSGLGADNVYRGDYDIQLFDEEMVEKYGLEDLRFGDLIAIVDADHSFGRIFKRGAVSIAVIVHSNCVISGHGPGACTIFTSRAGKIQPIISKKANLKHILDLKN